ncbi:MAG: type I methionyl aminopeptidase [Leptospirales bacterium]|jgi:methionyl aminopeptidase
MSIRDENDLTALRRVGKVVGDTLRLMLRSVEAGMSTLELDRIGEEYFQKRGARSAPRLTYDFPGATCISVNNEVAHGIPGERVLRTGDLVNIDVSLELDGYFADTGASMCIEPAPDQLTDLCRASHAILQATIHNIKAGNKLNRIGRTIENGARERGYTTVLNLAGHGVGGALHEEPYDLVNYYDPRDQRLAERGQVVAIETFISTGGRYAREEADGWTLTTGDGSFVAQYEHTLVITDGAPIILTA